MLGTHGSGCRPHEVEWQAGVFRWVDVYAALQEADPNDPPHPATAQWAVRGLTLPGVTVAEQLGALDRNPEVWRPVPAVIHGFAPVPVFESAAAALDDRRDAVTRLTNATRFLGLRSTEWIERRLYLDSDEDSEGDDEMASPQ